MRLKLGSGGNLVSALGRFFNSNPQSQAGQACPPPCALQDSPPRLLRPLARRAGAGATRRELLIPLLIPRVICWRLQQSPPQAKS